ncbi:hypothetical protein DSO57_1016854 [Entomophthora muscae]|uniref:Uncharacterized protein n=1 Tax=Entomophthora muscae TaxID=34485 RepID=A0ACC2S6R2_9FUNG|nr:hypothetical protein DSO57_1016854 [Entomophthora muscae]
MGRIYLNSCCRSYLLLSLACLPICLSARHFLLGIVPITITWTIPCYLPEQLIVPANRLPWPACPTAHPPVVFVGICFEYWSVRPVVLAKEGYPLNHVVTLVQDGYVDTGAHFPLVLVLKPSLLEQIFLDFSIF